jgi:dihydropteroate synthase
MSGEDTIRGMVMAERARFMWRLRTRSLQLGERTLVMAILNVTPDSFSGDGLLRTPSGLEATGGVRPMLAVAAAAKVAVAAAVEALDAGADILDLGAESTRPNAVPMEAKDEQKWLLPVIDGVLHARPHAIVSVDTYHAGTARAAAQAGAQIINDVSGLTWDEGMADVAAATGCGIVLMHTRGRPWEWAEQPALGEEAVVQTVFDGLCERLMAAEAAGIGAGRLVLDPGFGFGKRGVENWPLLAGLGRLHELGRPLLVGLSRKGFLAPALQPLERGAATDAANRTAVLAGAHILRVHDVRAAVAVAKEADAVLRQGIEEKG